MKKSLMFLSTALLAFSMVFMSACSDDDGGGGQAEIPAAPIKTISIDYYGDASEVEGWEFIYDDQGRVETINVSWNGEPDGTREYDYSVPGQLTITRNGNNGLVYFLDSEGRVIKEMGDDDDDETYLTYEYNSDGILTEISERWDGEDHLKFQMTVTNDNVTHRIRYEDDGTTVREDREFIYTSGDNASEVHQIYAVDSEWRWVGGLYGTQSKKLVNSFVRHLTEDPESAYGATFVYVFDDETNTVTTVTKNGTSADGNYTEILSYSYYPIEE